MVWNKNNPDSKVRGANNTGPIWGRQGTGGPHFGPMNFAIWKLPFCVLLSYCYCSNIGKLSIIAVTKTHITLKSINAITMKHDVVSYYINNILSYHKLQLRPAYLLHFAWSFLCKHSSFNAKRPMFCPCILDSMWHSDAIRRHRSGSTSAQIIWMTTASHFLN